MLEYTYNLIYLLSVMSAMPQNIKPPEIGMKEEQMKDAIT